MSKIVYIGILTEVKDFSKHSTITHPRPCIGTEANAVIFIYLFIIVFVFIIIITGNINLLHEIYYKGLIFPLCE